MHYCFLAAHNCPFVYSVVSAVFYSIRMPCILYQADLIFNARLFYKKLVYETVVHSCSKKS